MSTSSPDAEPSQERTSLADRVSEHPYIALLLVVAAVWAAVTSLSDPIGAAYAKVFWRTSEETKIESLRIGQTVDYVKVSLGEPDLMTEPDSGGTTYRWKGRGYNVWAYAEENSVSSYLVFVCDDQLRPQLDTGERTITANETTFAEASGKPNNVFYNWAPSFIEYYEVRAEGRSGDFRYLIWGSLAGGLSGGAQDMAWRGQGNIPRYCFVRRANQTRLSLSPLAVATLAPSNSTLR